MARRRRTSKRKVRQVSIERRHERDEERPEDETAIFERRAEWFRDLHTDRQGCLPPEGRRQAIEQASRLGRVPLREFDPGGPAPKRGFELIGGERAKPRLRVARNPRPNSSFGFAGRPVEVHAGGDLRGATLKIALDKRQVRGLDSATIRIFRFDDATREWQIVPRSGASARGDYAWAALRRPGLYIPVGLPRDPWLLRTIMVIQTYLPWLRAARTKNAMEKLMDPICKLILCDGVFKDARGDPAVADKLGLPPFEGGIGPGNICDRCFGLDLPVSGLPEGSILIDPGVVIIVPPIIVWPFFCPKWVSAGPKNFNGRIKSLAIHPTSGSIVYAGGADGGVWKTTDGGVSWYATMQLELSMAIGALGISASSPSVLYAATGEDTPGWGPSYPGIGAYKTTDGGGDWDLLAPIASTRCTRVLVHPTDPNIVYVAGNSGLHKSTDGGASWTDVRTDHCSDALMDPLSPDVLYAGVWNSGVYKSVTGGSTWIPLTTGIPTGASAGWIKLAMGLSGTDGTAFLVAKMGPDSGDMYKSNTAGTSWTAIPGTHQAASYNEWTNMVAVDPGDQDVIFAGGVGLERTDTGGTSFSAVGGTHSDHHALVFSPIDSDICYMATDGGVYKSTDNGVTWTLQSYGLISTQLYSIGVAQTSPLVLGGATQDQGIIKSDGSPDWVNTGAGNEGGFFIVDPNSSSNIYTNPWGAKDLPRRSTDGGVSWTTISNGLGTIEQAWTVSGATFTDRTAVINSDAVADVPIPGAAVDNALYVGASYKFARFNYLASTLGAGGVMTVEYWNGSAWTALTVSESPAGAKNFTAPSGSFISWGAPDDWALNAVNGVTKFWIRFRVTTAYGTSPVLSQGFIPPNFGIRHLAVKPGDSLVLLCAGDSKVFRSTDQGTKWNEVLSTSGTATQVVFSASTPSICYAATNTGRVYRSSGSGASGSWSEPYTTANQPPAGWINALAVGWTDSNLVYIGYVNWGMAHTYRSTDGGAHWANASGVLARDALPDIPVSAIVIDQYNAEVVYVSTDIGVFRTRDGGDSWEHFHDGMPRIVTSELVLRKSTNTLYASTMGRGAFKRGV